MRRRQELKRTVGFKGANVRRPTVVARETHLGDEPAIFVSRRRWTSCAEWTVPRSILPSGCSSQDSR